MRISVLIFVIMLAMANQLARAQEGTTPMRSNANMIYSDLSSPYIQTSKMNASKSATASLSLPFFDDFYYATTSNYPDPLKWSDSLVYVNTGMAKAPLTIGVATFDGLNKKGYAYTPNQNFTPTQAFAADTLTSRTVNLFTLGSQTLQPSDSIALIFYYQLTGFGDSPEVQDSLVLDFYKPAQAKWNNKVWSLRGNTSSNNNDTIFKRAFVWVTDTAYFHDGFKFRFRNKAATNGNFDNWQLDHVYLDKNRSMINDTAWNDLSIGYVPTPFLNKYSAMPWQQFTPADMATKYSNYIRYNGTSTVNTTYEIKVLDQTNTQVHSASYGALNLPPFKPAGWQHDLVHAFPSLSYTFNAMTDSVDYTIKHYMLNLAGDVNVGNDTVIQKQRFRNYFAYDDGSCETGYYINGFGGIMALKYTLNFGDTLRALRIYFDPVGPYSTKQNDRFRIHVYTGSSGGPINLIYKDSIMYPKFSTTGHNAFATYTLSSPLVLNQGTYFVGIQQFADNGGFVTVGFDRNYDYSQNLYYNSGSGWNQSSVKGALMIRPVFGKKIEPPVGIREEITNTLAFSLFPNPSANAVTINMDEPASDLSYSITSAEGKFIKGGTIEQKTTVLNTSEIQSGLYFVTILKNGRSLSVKKLIVQH